MSTAMVQCEMELAGWAFFCDLATLHPARFSLTYDCGCAVNSCQRAAESLALKEFDGTAVRCPALEHGRARIVRADVIA